MEALADAILEGVRAHIFLAPPVVFVLAFGESLAFVSLLLPATFLLMSGSGIVGAAGVGFWPIWIAATVGAFLGDWVSYWLGFHYKERIAGIWPLSRYPALLVKGHAFFVKWGAVSVFLGRFFGPLRCVVPLVAGIAEMPQIPFQIANVASAVVWATGVLAPGHLAVGWLLS
jgi:membrane protein DedA with SNARE-associated domain